jgi:hypothetical protein
MSVNLCVWIITIALFVLRRQLLRVQVFVVKKRPLVESFDELFVQLGEYLFFVEVSTVKNFSHFTQRHYSVPVILWFQLVLEVSNKSILLFIARARLRCAILLQLNYSFSLVKEQKTLLASKDSRKQYMIQLCRLKKIQYIKLSDQHLVRSFYKHMTLICKTFFLPRSIFAPEVCKKTFYHF